MACTAEHFFLSIGIAILEDTLLNFMPHFDFVLSVFRFPPHPFFLLLWFLNTLNIFAMGTPSANIL